MRVVVMVQENHTTDNYFRALAPYGADVATGWPTSPNPPPGDQPHDRRAYFDWLTEGTATHTQFDTVADLRFYLYLALTGAFVERHCSGFGTNSTPNHLLLVGGQSPTLKNPSRTAMPEWDMPSVPGLAEDNGVEWRAYAAPGDYPVAFYTQLKGAPNVLPSARFVAAAAAGALPPLVYLWHDPPDDEHPAQNVTDGMNAVWRAVAAVVAGGGWRDTVFLLTWDDWGGYDDHVHPPPAEYTPDNVQLAPGPRVPLLMFGGPVKPGIAPRWSAHPSVAKTAIQLLGLPPLGVPRVDDDPGLADLADAARDNPPPPAFGEELPIPAAPDPPVAPAPVPPPPVARAVPVPPVILRGGGQLPAPDDVQLPHQPQPPG